MPDDLPTDSTAKSWIPASKRGHDDRVKVKFQGKEILCPVGFGKSRPHRAEHYEIIDDKFKYLGWPSADAHQSIDPVTQFDAQARPPIWTPKDPAIHLASLTATQALVSRLLKALPRLSEYGRLCSLSSFKGDDVFKFASNIPDAASAAEARAMVEQLRPLFQSEGVEEQVRMCFTVLEHALLSNEIVSMKAKWANSFLIMSMLGQVAAMHGARHLFPDGKTPGVPAVKSVSGKTAQLNLAAAFVISALVMLSSDHIQKPRSKVPFSWFSIRGLAYWYSTAGQKIFPNQFYQIDNLFWALINRTIKNATTMNCHEVFWVAFQDDVHSTLLAASTLAREAFAADPLLLPRLRAARCYKRNPLTEQIRRAENGEEVLRFLTRCQVSTTADARGQDGQSTTQDEHSEVPNVFSVLDVLGSMDDDDEVEDALSGDEEDENYRDDEPMGSVDTGASSSQHRPISSFGNVPFTVVTEKLHSVPGADHTLSAQTEPCSSVNLANWLSTNASSAAVTCTSPSSRSHLPSQTHQPVDSSAFLPPFLPEFALSNLASQSDPLTISQWFNTGQETPPTSPFRTLSGTVPEALSTMGFSPELTTTQQNSYFDFAMPLDLLMLASASTPFNPSTSMTDNELITALLTLQDTSFSLDGFGESGNSSSLPNTTATTIDSSERSINPRDLSVRQKDTTSDMAIDSQQIPAETCNVVPVHGGSGALSPHCANPPQPLTSSLPAIYPALLSSDDNGGDADQSSLSVAAQGSHSTADISLPSLASDKSNATSPTPFSSDISRWVETVYQEYTSPSDVRVIILPRFGSGINSTLVAGTLFWGALHTRTCSRLRRMMQQRQSQVKKSKCKNINVARSPSTEQDGPDTHSHGLNTPSALQVQDQICFEENEKAAASHPERDTSSDTSQDMEEDSADELAQDDDLSSESDVSVCSQPQYSVLRTFKDQDMDTDASEEVRPADSTGSVRKKNTKKRSKHRQIVRRSARTKPIDLRSHLAMGRAATQQAVAAAAKYRKCKTHTPKPVNQFELDTVREVTGEEWDIDASAGGRHLPIYSLPEDWLSLREAQPVQLVAADTPVRCFGSDARKQIQGLRDAPTRITEIDTLTAHSAFCSAMSRSSMAPDESAPSDQHQPIDQGASPISSDTAGEQSDRVDPVLLFHCHLPRPWLAPMSQREHVRSLRRFIAGGQDRVRVGRASPAVLDDDAMEIDWEEETEHTAAWLERLTTVPLPTLSWIAFAKRVAEFGPPTTIMQGRVPDVHGAPVDDKDQLYTLSLWDFTKFALLEESGGINILSGRLSIPPDYVDWLRRGFCTIIHVKHGVKRVIVKIPRKKLSDRKKIHLSDYDESFFDSYIINLNAGEWVILPPLTLHQVFTPVHSCAVGGHYIGRGTMFLSMKASIIINHSFSIFTNASHNQAVVSLLHRHVLLALHPFDATLRSFAMNGELSVSDTNLLPHDSDLVICCGAVVFADIIWPSESDQHTLVVERVALFIRALSSAKTREVSDGALAAVQNAYAAAAEYCILDGEELSNEALAEAPYNPMTDTAGAELSRCTRTRVHGLNSGPATTTSNNACPMTSSYQTRAHTRATRVNTSPEDSDPEFEAELVVGHVDGADALVHGERAYMVKWKGYPDSENCLVTASDTYNMRDLVHEYWDRQRQRNARKTRRKRQKMRRRHQDSHPNPSSSSSS
ncbi:hypothetical protein BKA62DRAFT_673695 [Auriculariales sp. MPI-PUGE-AT-0066]|nr:hypothetical protein BKA62DRAFT_673695 [Auriculariales sp. MPI-PUGE-AT-0066]